MGTNYYHVDECLCCGHKKRVHIGKSSVGWTFALRIHRDLDLLTWEAWQDRLTGLAYFNWCIEDEYGEVIDFPTFKRIVEDRRAPDDRFKDGSVWEPFGVYDTEGRYHFWNASQRGPNGLLRRIIGSRQGCVGHGEGTWDYIEGDFS